MVENAFGILVSRFIALLDTMNQRPVFRNIVFICMVLYNILRTHHGSADRAPTPANDITALQNEKVMYVPHNNYRNLSREAKHHQDLLKDYFNPLDALAWYENRI